MRPASTALTAYLNNAANLTVVQADLYTFALVSGEILRYSGWTGALTIPAAGFPSGSINAGADRTFALGPRFGRSRVGIKIGVEPAELDIEVLAGAGDLIGSFTFAAAVRLGLLDGATVELDRLFAPAGGGGAVGMLDTSLGTLLWFYGRVADCDIGRSKILVKVKSLMNLLAIQQMPRRLYGAACSHVFGDPMCGYNRTAGTNALGQATGIGQVNVSAAAGTTQSEIHTGFVPADPSPYIEGTVTGLAGANAGVMRTVSDHLSGTVFFKKPFLFPIALGDTFTLLPGCPHTTDGCTVRNNLLRFGGFPHIPPPEAAA